MACQPVEMLVSPPSSLAATRTSVVISGTPAVSLTMPAVGVALDVVDVGLVERPGVDLALGPVVGVVDRAIVEAEGLGGAVQRRGRRATPAWPPRGCPRWGRRRRRRCVRLQRLGLRRHVGVRRVDEVGVGRGRLEGGLVAEPSRAVGRAVVVVGRAASSPSSSSEQAAAEQRAGQQRRPRAVGGVGGSRRFSSGRTGHPIELGMPYSASHADPTQAGGQRCRRRPRARSTPARWRSCASRSGSSGC